MFMTNYELIYGECKGTSSNSSSTVHREQPTPTKEKGKGAETAVKAAKAVVGAHVAAAKFAGGAVSKLSRKAVDYARSDYAAEKAEFAKEKAGAAFAGLKGKASAFAERKKADNSDTPVDDVIENANDVTEETYNDTETADNVEEIAESASFDELYEKAMNTADDEDSFDEAAATEDDTMDGYSEETVNEKETPVTAPSVSQAPAPTVIPQPAPRKFSYEEEKKSPVVFVLVGVIAVLLVGMGILGGMLLMKNKDDKGSGNSSNNEVIATTDDITTGETTASIQETTSEIVTTTQETATEAAATSFSETTISDIAVTTQASAPKASITASLIEEPALQGVTVYLVVSGDYSSYSYTSYVYDAGGGTPSAKNGNSSSGKVEITAFSGGVSKVVVEVTPYNSDGVAGDTISTTYTPKAKNPSVTSCTKYGTIYSPNGNKVDGLTRSYLIDGGTAAYERHDLTHGWHVTAVNEYFDGSTYWYELYDSDDGDYYGWVVSYNISFY